MNAMRILRSTRILSAGLLVAGALAMAVPVRAQGTVDPVQDQLRSQERDRQEDAAQVGAGSMERIRQRLETAGGLDETARERMRANLDACEALGLGVPELEALFPGAEVRTRLSVQTQLKLQEQVLAMERRGEGAEPVLEKLAEGCMKGAGEPLLLQAAERMQRHVATAHRFVEQVGREGVTLPESAGTRRTLAHGLALDLWRGLDAGDLDHLRERARDRLRNGSCDLVDVAAAAETAAQLRENGVEGGRAVRLAGQALQQGYTAREMRQIAHMYQAAHRGGGDGEETLRALEGGVGRMEDVGAMARHLFQHGWMGPESGGHGGGHSPVDDVIGGGPGGGGHEGGGPGGPGGGGHHGG
jgi:hypothetical protein